MTDKAIFQPPVLVELTVEHISQLAPQIKTDPALDVTQRHEKLQEMGLISTTTQSFNMANLVSATPDFDRTRLQFNDATTAYVTESKEKIEQLTLIASRRVWLALNA